MIWRYLDFAKFVSLLETRSLFFCRSDKFEDRFEGSYPQYNVRQRPTVYGGQDGIDAEGLQKISTFGRTFRSYMAINCWHANQHESAAMWKLYLKSNDGIAIQTTYTKLNESLKDAKEDVYIGMVNYIDYESEWMPEGNVFYPFAHKRKSFAHENELRAITYRFPGSPKKPVDPFEEGININLDIDKLIENIYIAPGSPAWVTQLIKSVAKKYEIRAPVINSRLAEEPVY